jgi:hypothetical protein
VVVERRVENSAKGHARWDARCDVCGDTHAYIGHALRQSPPKFCRNRVTRKARRKRLLAERLAAGLAPKTTSKLIDITGQRFGCLVVESRAPGINTHWNCRCDTCGGVHTLKSWDLRMKQAPDCANLKLREYRRARRAEAKRESA